MRKIATILLLASLSIAHGADRFVSPTGSGTPPYNSWATAATGLVEALTGSADGDTITVTNGTYIPWGATAVYTNLTWKSVNGPDVTVIKSTGNYIGDLYAGSYYGFTFRNSTGAYQAVYMSNVGIVSNCIFSDNYGTHAGNGGGVIVYGGKARFYNCQFLRNTLSSGTARGSGAGIQTAAAEFYDCIFSNNVAGGEGAGVGVAGGGTGTLVRCVLTWNVSSSYGAAASAVTFGTMTLSNCVVSYNNGGTESGAAINNGEAYNSLFFGNYDKYNSVGVNSKFHSCTMIGNYSYQAGISTLYASDGENNIIYYNYSGSFYAGSWSNTCYQGSFASPTLINCITSAPVFVDDYATALATPSAANCGTGFVLLASGLAGLAIQTTSPCKDTGTNIAWTASGIDYVGNARIYNSVVDIGAYEYTVAPAASSRRRYVEVN